MNIESKCVSNVLSDFILKSKVIPFSIGFVFSFDQDDKPEVLVSICQEKEVEFWMDRYGGKAKYYVWNSAEYEIFEDESLYIDINQWGKMDSREQYIDFFIGLLPTVKSNVKIKTGYEPYLFTHDLDDDNFQKFTTLSLSNEEINELKVKSLL